MTAGDILRAEGHDLDGAGVCRKCWQEAAWLYATGDYSSQTEAYYRVMDRAQIDADRRAIMGVENAT